MFYLFFGILSVFLLAVFFVSPLGEHIENHLFDIRSRIKPALSFDQKIGAINVGRADLNKGVNFRSRSLGERSSLYLNRMTEVHQALTKSKVNQIIYILYPHYVDLDSMAARQFVQRAAADPRVIFGILGIDTIAPSARQLPASFLGFDHRVFGMETFRNRRHQTVREFPLYSYQIWDLHPLLPTYVAASYVDSKFDLTKLQSSYGYIGKSVPNKILLNYLPPEKFSVLSSKDLLSSFEGEATEDDAGQLATSKLLPDIVLVGPYDLYLERPVNNEQISVNTPWQYEGDSPSDGESLAFVLAVAIDNLINNRYLRQPSWTVALRILLAVLILAMTTMIWRFNTVFAISGIFFIFILLTWVNSLLFSWLNIYLPMGETVVIGCLGTVAGGVWRLNIEMQARAAEQAKSDAREEVARTQAVFLGQFARELERANAEAVNCAHQLMERPDLKDKDLHEQLVAAAEEFQEYLRGINQFATFSDERVRRARSELVNIEALITRTASQFYVRAKERQIDIKISGEPQASFLTDPHMLEPIVFNLISNAVKYTNVGTKVTVDYAITGGMLVIDVVDQGDGIAEEYRERIFERFYRIRSSKTETIKGHGLGLYLCQYFAERLGATISVSSENAIGSRFRLKVPRLRRRIFG